MMKKVVTRILFIFLLLGYNMNFVFAQKSKELTLDEVLDNYGGMRAAESVELSGDILKFLSKSEKTSELLCGIQNVRIVSINKIDELADINSGYFIKSIKKIVSKNEYKNIMSVKSQGEELSIYMQEDKLLLISIDNEDSYSVVLIKGQITEAIKEAVVSGDISII